MEGGEEETKLVIWRIRRGGMEEERNTKLEIWRIRRGGMGGGEEDQA